jgi:hypothetical protein
VQLASLHRDNSSDEDPAPLPGMVPGDTQVAASGARRAPFGPQLPFGPALDLGKQMQRWWEGNQWPDPANENKRTSITNPIPPLPPQTPPPKFDNKTEFPASGPEVPSKLIMPIPSAANPNILTYPTPDKGLENFGNIVEDRRETAATKAQIDRLADWFYETHSRDEWEQHGGRDENGKEIKEFYIPGPAGDFEGGDGRPGSRRPDLTFINKKTGRRVHIQTTDVDKNGQVAPRERDAEHDIQRFEFLRGRNPDRPYSTQIFIIPKNAPIEKLQPIK